MFSHYAYMSETGDYQLTEDTPSRYFAITFIIVEKVAYESMKENLDWLTLGIEGNQNRLQFLADIVEDLEQFPVNFYSFIIDKDKLREKASFGQKETIFNYLNKHIYKTIFEQKINLQIQIFNEITDYQSSFIQFVKENHQPDLFDRSTFSFTDQSKDGFTSLAKIFSEVLIESLGGEDLFKEEPLSKLSKKIVRIERLPDFEVDIHVKNVDDIDTIIAEYAIEASKRYIRKYENSQIPVRRDRVNFLRFLLTQLTIQPKGYIYAQEIIDNIQRFSEEQITRDYLMREIIGPLRDAGLLIASTSQGYKIPISKEDLYDYVKFSSSMALPMLRRIEKGREIILDVTDGEFDILEYAEFEKLEGFLKE